MNYFNSNHVERMTEFCDELREHGLGNYEITITYDPHYSDPSRTVIPGQCYLDRCGRVVNYSLDPKVEYFEIYDLDHDYQYVGYFYDSMHLVEFLAKKNNMEIDDDMWDYWNHEKWFATHSL